jgi:hypothetical protein
MKVCHAVFEFNTRTDKQRDIISLHIVACRPVARQTTAKEAAIQQPLTTNGFANKHVCTMTIGNSNRG